MNTSRLISLSLAEEPTPAPALSSPTLKPTPQQAAFLSALTETDRNIALVARAGTGKTSSILMGVDAYTQHHPASELLICAYNKAIQIEIQDKLKDRGYDWRQVQCQTVHSMGWQLLKFTFGPQIEEHKVRDYVWSRADNLPLSSPFRAYSSQIINLVSLGKQAGIGFFDGMAIGDRSVWYRLADHYDVGAYEEIDLDAVVTCAQEVYRWSAENTEVIDFDDMILLPLIKNLRVKYTKDLILGDEVQDWSPVRQALVKKFVKPRTGRLVIVGDPKQAIYAWSGADAAAMENLTRELDAITLPLSVTWRCPKRVVELAQTLVPDLEAAPEAPEGEIIRQADLVSRAEWEATRGLDSDDYLSGDRRAPLKSTTSQILLDDLSPAPGKDAILCRNNAPLIPLAYKLIRAGIPAKVEGRKIGEGLQALCRRWQVRSTADLIRRLEDFRAREMQKFRAKGDEVKSMELEDRVDTLLEIVKEVNRRGKHDVESVIQFIDRLFGDEVKGAVTLATYHKSKGREWDRVILFEHSLRCPSRAARQEWQKIGEENLAYVAYTRAKKTLVFVG
jgi:superfamily I DNA/RNA helicase